MKKTMFLFTMALAWLVGDAAYAAPRTITWLTRYDEAVRVSKETNKPILMLFTGSDWCTWCIKLEQEALHTPEFAEIAGDKFVFLKLDFPIHKTVPADTLAQNKKLQKDFGVPGFPNIVLLDPQQKLIGTIGYKAGGGKQYALQLLKLIDEHGNYRQKLSTIDSEPISGNELKALYLYAIENKRGDEARTIALQGIASDQKNFFLLECYRQHVAEGAGHTVSVLAMRKQLLDSDPQNLKLTHYHVAMIDFEESCKKCKKVDDQVAILENYIQKYGEKDKSNAWRLRLLISQVFLENDRYEEALQYAKQTKNGCPAHVQNEISTVISNMELARPALGTL